MEQRAITQMEKSKKMAKADEKFRQAQAQYAKAVKDENDRTSPKVLMRMSLMNRK